MGKVSVYPGSFLTKSSAEALATCGTAVLSRELNEHMSRDEARLGEACYLRIGYSLSVMTVPSK